MLGSWDQDGAAPGARSWRLDFPASLDALDRVMDGARAFFSARAPAGADLFPLLTSLREGLLNAVIHGCARNPALRVSCSLSVEDAEALLEISDPGPGFDWRKRQPSMPQAAATSGRGRYIMSLYARSMEYNEKGNALTLRFTLA